MTAFEAAFANVFARWDTHLPLQATTPKQPGKIVQRGWMIRYVFGGDHLDHYAEHRMTNPRHVRIHSDVRIEPLEAPMDMYVVPKDADERARRRAKENFHAYNRRIYAILRAKGLYD